MKNKLDEVSVAHEKKLYEIACYKKRLYTKTSILPFQIVQYSKDLKKFSFDLILLKLCLITVFHA